jgi:hypothetical protein
MRKVDTATLNRDKNSDEVARSEKESTFEEISRLLVEYRVNAALSSAQGIPQKMSFARIAVLSISLNARRVAVNPR